MSKQLHFCWLVDPWAESREKYLAKWVKAGWSVVLWHGGQLASPPVEGIELRHADEIILGSPIENALDYERRHKNHAACADLFRYELLWRLGGAYCDIDIGPGKKALPTLLNRTEPVFGTCWWQRRRSLEIRFIVATAARHPLLQTLRDTAVANSAAFIAAGGHRVDKNLNHVLWRTGPGMAREVVKAYAKSRGVQYNSLLLNLATRHNTQENNGEHFHLKGDMISAIARA
jgi:mannosyltransferase OCH1-like enzyme